MAASFSHGMSRRSKGSSSNGSRGSSGPVTYLKYEYTIPQEPQRAWFNKYSTAYEDFQKEERARLSKNKERGEDYVRINSTKVEEPLPDGVYQTVCPSADNGLMKVIKNGVTTIQYEIDRRLIKRPLKAIEAIIAEDESKKLELENLKKNTVGMTVEQIEELAKNISQNKTELQRFIKPTQFWKYIEPEVIEDKKRKTENILTSLKYYKQAPGTGFLPDINYYRNYPPAKNGIATLKFLSFEGEYENRKPLFRQTYVDENGVEKKEPALVYNEPIWTRNMVLAKMYKSASTVGGKRRRTLRVRKNIGTKYAGICSSCATYGTKTKFKKYKR